MTVASAIALFAILVDIFITPVEYKRFSRLILKSIVIPVVKGKSLFKCIF